jgi:hypothetical protein
MGGTSSAASASSPRSPDHVMGVAVAVHPVADGEMAQRVDMGAHMHGHADALEVHADLVLGARRPARLHAVAPGGAGPDHVGRLVRRDARRLVLRHAAEVQDPAGPRQPPARPS